jgi:LemA protein
MLLQETAHSIQLRGRPEKESNLLSEIIIPKGTPVSSLNGTPIETVCAAQDAVAQAWTRLQALPPNQIGPVLAPTLVLQWTQLGAQTDAARSEFNQRVVNYNEAIQQFPALLLAWVLGFKPAQPI